MLHRETIPASKWLTIPISLVAVGAIALAVFSAEGTAAVIAASAGSLIAVTTLATFARLDVSVGNDEIVASFWWLKKRLDRAAITNIEVRSYDWKIYGGWGIRYSTKGRRAWTVPFHRTGVAVALTEEGKEREYYFTSRRPDELVAALGS